MFLGAGLAVRTSTPERTGSFPRWPPEHCKRRPVSDLNLRKDLPAFNTARWAHWGPVQERLVTGRFVVGRMRRAVFVAMLLGIGAFVGLAGSQAIGWRDLYAPFTSAV